MGRELGGPSTDSEGWYAEFRVPFSTLRYQEDGEQTWGVNFARNIRRRIEESFWSPIPRQFNLHRVSMAGLLSDFQAPSQRVLTVTPYALGDAFKDYTVPDPDAELGTQVGGDAKIGSTRASHST